MDHDRKLCRVCVRQYAKYSCPRCNSPYCSLTCYKQHSRDCTESFYREQSMAQLKGTSAGEDEKRRMQQILQRVQQQGYDDEDSDESEGSDDDPDSDVAVEVPEELQRGLQGVVSQETLKKLMIKASKSLEGLEISEQDLTPQEWAQWEQAVASGRLGIPPAPQPPLPLQQQPPRQQPAALRLELAGASATEEYRPWWRTEAATALQLTATGQRVVEELGAEPHAAGSLALQQQQQPPPPPQPLPRLAQLTRATPSPLLGLQLLDVLFGYCLVWRHYNGQHAEDCVAAAEMAAAASSVLGAAISSASTAGALPEPPQSVAEVVHNTVSACTRPPLAVFLAGGHAHAALEAWTEVLALLALGRVGCVLAATECERWLTAAAKQVQTANTTDPSAATALSSKPSAEGAAAKTAAARDRNAAKQRKRGCVAAARKAYFLAVWANEQPPGVFEQLAAGAQLECEQQLSSLRRPVSRQQAANRRVASKAPTVQELPERRIPDGDPPGTNSPEAPNVIASHEATAQMRDASGQRQSAEAPACSDQSPPKLTRLEELEALD